MSFNGIDLKQWRDLDIKIYVETSHRELRSAIKAVEATKDSLKGTELDGIEPFDEVLSLLRGITHMDGTNEFINIDIDIDLFRVIGASARFSLTHGEAGGLTLEDLITWDKRFEEVFSSFKDQQYGQYLH